MFSPLPFGCLSLALGVFRYEYRSKIQEVLVSVRLPSRYILTALRLDGNCKLLDIIEQGIKQGYDESIPFRGNQDAAR